MANDEEKLELPIVDMITIATATNKFSDTNKIGEGGFRPIYIGGYMSPEYAIDGLFSMKSNVFSFGVIILEIMSGKRNRIFRHSDHDLNLLGRTWNLWTEERAFELLDPMMEGSFPMSKVLRCIQVGLLCMQKCPEDRPMMSSVFLMLVSDSAILPQPKQPGFYIERTRFDYPTNTMLPSIKLGLEWRTGLYHFLTSWKSCDDPSTGEYFYRMDPSGLPQSFLYKGPTQLWRTGPWIGDKWSGIAEIISTTTKDFSWKDSGHCGEICCGHLPSDYLLFGNDKEKKSHAILRYLACAFPGVADHWGIHLIYSKGQRSNQCWIGITLIYAVVQLLLKVKNYFFAGKLSIVRVEVVDSLSSSPFKEREEQEQEELTR
ncbi:unnamed protein product [Camellia sinensis]